MVRNFYSNKLIKFSNINMNDNENDENNRNMLCQHRPWNGTAYNFLLAYQNRLTIRNTLNWGSIEMLGQQHLQIYKVTLPFDATSIFQKIISAYNEYGSTFDNNYSGTTCKSTSSLYSLTKHDVAIVDLPGNILNLFQEIQSYVVTAIQHLYYIPSSQRVYLDRHQPHVLKYNTSSEQSFRSVPLHHDCCHGKLTSDDLTS
jgi:hypothetical protein